MTLGKTIVLLLSGLLIGTVLLIGGVAYFTTRASIRSLSDALLAQIDQGVQQEMLAYFTGAEPAARFMDQAVFNEEDAIENWRDRALTLARFLETEPNIIYLYFGERDSGHLLGALRDQDGRIIVTRLHADSGPATQYFAITADDGLEPIADLPLAGDGIYDIRTRPWFKEAVRVDGLVWTPPYEFLNNQNIGLTAALAKRDADGRVLGVLAADVVLAQLASFLDGLEAGEHGSAFIMLEDGSFPVPREARHNPHIDALRQALESQDWKLAGLPDGEVLKRRFSFDGVTQVALIKSLMLPGRTRYFAGVIVPESDFLGVVWRNGSITLAVAAGILVIAILLGTLLSRRVTQPLALISEELERIGNLSFPKGQQTPRSNIHEIARFTDSVGKMKVTLSAFSRYVPRDIVRLLLSRGDEARLGGRLESVTVVFTDLAGFTQMSEGMPADEAFSELSDFLEIVTAGNGHFEGITSTFTGDGTLALFNAPEPLDGHEQKAVLAAMHCLAELEKLNVRRRSEGKFEFRARIGINTAEVLLGNIGTAERFAYTAIGDGVNLASRLEGLNKIYGTKVLVGEECRRVAGEAVAWRMIDRIAVVGRRQSSLIYEPLAPAQDADPARLTARDVYERALAAYFDTDFARAESLFNDALDAFPDDSAAQVMAARCRAYRDQPPPAEWDGTFIAPFK